MEINSIKLVYFSPTGSTRKIMERIVRETGCANVEILDITSPGERQRRLQPGENDLLLIGVPVYAGRVPPTVIEWLETMEAYHTPAVCVVVYGNRAYDDALLELKDSIMEKGCIPIACAAYIGEHAFSSSETPIAVGRPDEDDLEHADLFARKIREKLSCFSLTDHTAITVPGNRPYKDIGAPETIFPSDFIAIDNNCTKCGTCVECCPVNAIHLANGIFTDKEQCIKCCACIRKCPVNARVIKHGKTKNIVLRLSQTCQEPKRPVFFM